jgi:hypothetical protein
MAASRGAPGKKGAGPPASAMLHLALYNLSNHTPEAFAEPFGGKRLSLNWQYPENKRGDPKAAPWTTKWNYDPR